MAGPALWIESVAFAGSLVQVAVANPGDAPATGTVVATVLTLAGEVTVTAPVALDGGSTVGVTLGTPAPVVEVIQCGVVVDDGSPF